MVRSITNNSSVPAQTAQAPVQAKKASFANAQAMYEKIGADHEVKQAKPVQAKHIETAGKKVPPTPPPASMKPKTAITAAKGPPPPPPPRRDLPKETIVAPPAITQKPETNSSFDKAKSYLETFTATAMKGVQGLGSYFKKSDPVEKKGSTHEVLLPPPPSLDLPLPLLH